MKLVNRAWLFAKTKHGEQLDDDGNYYFFVHVVVVSNVIRMMTNDQEVIAAALLHDVIEDTDTTYNELKEVFGEKIANLVNEVTHDGEKDNYGYYFPHLKSRDAIMIKLADRMSNISRMSSWDIARQEHYLKHTRFWKTGEDK